MPLEDRLRPSVDAALVELTTRVDQDVRSLVQQLVSAAVAERDAATRNVREVTIREAAAETARQVEEAEAQARVRERDAEMAAVGRLLDSIRALDAAKTLSEVLDGLAQAAARETERAGVLVVRQDRLIGWRFVGFGEHDVKPRAIDLSLNEKNVLSTAIAEGRSASTRQAPTEGPLFAKLAAEHIGLAVPVNVGGRAVAVVYTDNVAVPAGEQRPRDGWPQVVEVLARHAARCLEALTVQKTANAAAPRFWMQAANRPAATV